MNRIANQFTNSCVRFSIIFETIEWLKQQFTVTKQLSLAFAEPHVSELKIDSVIYN